MPDSGCPPESELKGRGAGEPPNLSPRDLDLLLDACRVVVEAWHGQSSISLDLAMSHLEAILRRKRKQD